MSDESKLGWWVISGEDFGKALRRAHEGEDPAMLYIEYYGNSDVSRVEGDET